MSYVFKRTLTINIIFANICRNSHPFHLLFFVKVLPFDNKRCYHIDMRRQRPHQNHASAVHRVRAKRLHNVHWQSEEKAAVNSMGSARGEQGAGSAGELYTMNCPHTSYCCGLGTLSFICLIIIFYIITPDL